MCRRKISVSVIVVFLVSFVIGVCGQVPAIEFSADIKEQYGEKIRAGMIYVYDSVYCMDIFEQEGEVRVVVDEHAGKTTVIPLTKGEYIVLDIDDRLSIMNDPFQSYKYQASHGEEKQIGTEMVNGYECDKFVVTMSGTEIVTKWVAGKLRFPIKIVVNSEPERIMELRNIKEGPVDKSMFAIPEGFTERLDPRKMPVPPPTWAADIASAPILTPPFERDMSAGDIIRIAPRVGKSLAIKGTSLDDNKAVAKVLPFTDGHPLKRETMYNNFAQQGVICERRHETSAEIDEFIVRVYEGNVQLKAKWLDMVEETIPAGKELRYVFEGHDNVLTYLVNVHDGESVAIVNYLQDGKPVSEEKIGPLSRRTITLPKLHDKDKTTRTVTGDELIIRVEKGKIDIKVGQFDPFQF